MGEARAEMVAHVEKLKERIRDGDVGDNRRRGEVGRQETGESVSLLGGYREAPVLMIEEQHALAETRGRLAELRRRMQAAEHVENAEAVGSAPATGPHPGAAIQLKCFFE